jgi:hypothetical protein
MRHTNSMLFSKLYSGLVPHLFIAMYTTILISIAHQALEMGLAFHKRNYSDPPLSNISIINTPYLTNHALFIASIRRGLAVLVFVTSDKRASYIVHAKRGRYTTHTAAFRKRSPSSSLPLYASSATVGIRTSSFIQNSPFIQLPPILRLITPDINTPPTMNACGRTTKRAIFCKFIPNT